jgi:hypothetical protein
VDEDLLSRGARRGDPAGLVLGHYSSARTLGLVGKFAICRSHLEEVTARYDPVSHRSLFHQTGLHLHVSSQAYLGLISSRRLFGHQYVSLEYLLVSYWLECWLFLAT